MLDKVRLAMALDRGPRTFPLEALPDGSYVIGGGLIVTLPVRFAPDSDGMMHMELERLEIVRRTDGLR